ncbi:MAG: DUF1684 domain-containing protein [Woeseiaceae bacterium]|nr:DUF1684 domain-containing protein [Woeseiaceae bacterium]
MLAAVLVAAMLAGACSGGMGDADLAAYRAGIEAWRAERLARLKGPDGYLNLAGLFWLDQANATLGSAPDNDIVLPASAAPRVGRLEVTADGVVIVTEPGVDVRYEGVPVRSLLISDDTTAAPVTITHGSLAWTIIRRDDRFALRLRDFEHPAIEAFPPLEYYPIDPAYRVDARLERFETPRVLNVDTVIEGLGWHPESPGLLVFELGGEIFDLEAYAAGDELFLVFGDRTSGRETYPAGRFLYAPMPGPDGRTVLDFNKAYNPPCAFNDFATCPVASPRNRLATRIEAGEKYDPGVHFTPDSVH